MIWTFRCLRFITTRAAAIVTARNNARLRLAATATATVGRQRAPTPALANWYTQKKKVFGNILLPPAVWIRAQTEHATKNQKSKPQIMRHIPIHIAPAQRGDAAEEATLSRIFAGQHFRFDLTTGERLGREVADFVVDHFLTSRHEEWDETK
jgi:hypothetical protein